MTEYFWRISLIFVPNQIEVDLLDFLWTVTQVEKSWGEFNCKIFVSRSRLALHADRRDWPSTTSCWESRRSWALMPNLPELTLEDHWIIKSRRDFANKRITFFFCTSLFFFLGDERSFFSYCITFSFVIF